MSLAFVSTDLLWRNALAAVPLALAVALICRSLPCRSSTRHLLWLIVLLSLLAPPLVPEFDVASDLIDGMKQSATEVGSEQSHRETIVAHDAKVSPSGTGDHAKPPAWSLMSSANQAQLDSVEQSQKLRNGSMALRSPTLHAAPSSAPPDKPATVHIAPRHRPDPDARVAEPVFSSATSPAPATAHGVSAGVPAPIAVSSSKYDQWLEAFGPNKVFPRLQTWRDHQIAAPPPSVLKDEISQPAPAEAVSLVASIEWQDWFNRLIALRDALIRLPQIPSLIWWAGSVLALALVFFRMWRFGRVLKQARPAPATVQRQVEVAARSIGLRVAPQTMLVDRQISPLIWCGRRRLLILPAGLWSELDSVGRDAVLLHELAHLRRRDHWVCWAELLVCCVYWWHPLVWWIRRRLRDEADFSCDAWVTSVLPTARSAYARALLTTRQYINESHLAPPAVGLGVTTAKAKRFARRLTMVMTNRSTPRLSYLGTALALCLAAGAWLSTPLWACPPEEQPSAAQETKGVKIRVPHVVVAPKPAQVTVAPSAMADPKASTFERHMAAREHLASALHADGSSGDVEDRLNRLEERLNRLTEHLERMMGAQHAPDVSGHPGPVLAPAQPRARSRAVPAPPAPPALPRAGQHPMPGAPMPPMGGGGGVMQTEPEGGEIISRVYNLPEGKLEALVELMARDDVPVQIARVEGGIQVNGTARQHEIFAAFVRLIDPDNQPAPPTRRQGAMGAGADASQRGLVVEQLRRARQTELNKAREGVRKQHQQQMQSLRKSIESQQKSLKEKMPKLREKAGELRRKATEMRERATTIERDAQNLNDVEQQRILAEAQNLMAQADAFEAQADANDGECDALAEAWDGLQEHLDSQREQLEEQLASLEEQLSDQLEAELESMEEAADAQAEAEEAAREADEEAAEAAAEAEAEAAEAAQEAEAEAAAEAEEAEEDEDPR